MERLSRSCSQRLDSGANKIEFAIYSHAGGFVSGIFYARMEAISSFRFRRTRMACIDLSHAAGMITYPALKRFAMAELCGTVLRAER